MPRYEKQVLKKAKIQRMHADTKKENKRIYA